jgi:hypothetical protein
MIITSEMKFIAFICYFFFQAIFEKYDRYAFADEEKYVKLLT